jgi:hypothetical protein
MATSINIRSFPEKITTLITFTEITKITEIIEKTSNISDADIADTNDINTIFENIEDAPFENITVEPAPIRKSTRHRKAIFKIMGANAITANAIGVAEAPTTSADKEENEEKNYPSKIMIAKIIIINENKLTYEKTIANLEKS